MNQKQHDTIPAEKLKQDWDNCNQLYESIRQVIVEESGNMVDWKLVDKAWVAIKKLYADTRRKSDALYVIHPCSVMGELAKRCVKTSMLVAALLHDTLKDKKLTFDEIQSHFGIDTARIVSAVATLKQTDIAISEMLPNMSKTQKKNVLDEYILPQISNYSHQSEAVLIYLVDRTENLKSLNHCDQSKRQRCIESTRFIAMPLAQRTEHADILEMLKKLCLAREMEECNREYKKICKSIKKQPGYVVDWQLIGKAWATAKDLHGDVRRKSDELYVTHPLSVMEELAKLRCKSSVLAAALLHDTMEDCSLSYERIREDFSYEVAQIVYAVTNIKAEEKSADPHYASMSDDEKHLFLDCLTDAKLIASPYQREAFLVRFADRVHNLSTIEACSTGKRMEKIASTRAFLIPAAQKLGMRYFEVLLSDLCMRFDGEEYHENESARILESRTALTKVSGGAYSHFDQVLQDALEAQNVFSFPKFNPFAKLRGYAGDGGEEEMIATSRRVLLGYELKQQLERVTYFDRCRLDLWEIILTYKERDTHDMLRHFLDMYRKYLKDELFFEYIGRDTESVTIRLTDMFENNYRVVIVPESRLEAYFIGDPEGERLTMIDEEAPGDALRPQITVYSYSTKKGYRKYAKRIPYGATALDFAFIISPALAVTVNSARIHKWKGTETNPFTDEDYAYPLRTVLSDGDVVHFDADYHPKPTEGETDSGKSSIPHATIDWFADVNTELGKNCLIRYFKDKYPEK